MPLFQPDFKRIDRHRRSDAQAVECFFVNNRSNSTSSWVKVLKLSTNQVCYTNNVTWSVARVPVLAPTLPAAGRDSNEDSGEVSDAITSPSYIVRYTAPTSVAATSPIAVSQSTVPATTLVSATVNRCVASCRHFADHRLAVGCASNGPTVFAASRSPPPLPAYATCPASVTRELGHEKDVRMEGRVVRERTACLS